ncbi:MAG: hypothetical protein Q7U60_03815 [Candidatus Methanoperedens sp.]|nr:hypothetical protein [Candidatus Methanoperedens sp.]
MDKKTLAILAVVLIVAGIAGLVLSSSYSPYTYGGYSSQWSGYGGMMDGGMMGGSGGMMGSGMMGAGMMGNMMQMMGGNMLLSGGVPYNQDGTMLSVEQAEDIANRYLASQNAPDLELADLEEWEFNFYAEYGEKNTSIGAFQIVIDKYTGAVSPEMGPNMMWNTKYGLTGLRAGAMPVTQEQAAVFAQKFLDARFPGTTAGYESTFYGYYHFDVMKNGTIYGMLDVNGYSGQVWYHTWHGNYIR